MVDAVLWMSTAALGLGFLFIIYWLLRKPPVLPEAPVPLLRPRMVLRRGRREVPGPEPPPEEEKEEEESALSKKEQQKQAKKAEKKASREQMKAAWEEKEKRLTERNEKYRDREREIEEKFLQEEEKARLLAEEKAKKEEEEFNHWKQHFEVSASGEDVLERSGVIQRFIDYVKLRKVVLIEDLAAEFGMDGKTVKSRLHDLEESGQLSGVVDERGKYIYIPKEELEAVKRFLERKGRVSKAELCMESNRLIRLEPTAEDLKRIQQEERVLMESLENELSA